MSSSGHEASVEVRPWRQLLSVARKRRAELRDRPDLDTFRVFHGAGEGAPGWNVDGYAGVAILTHPSAEAGAQRVERAALAEVLIDEHGFESVMAKPIWGRRSAGRERGAGPPQAECILGPEPPDEVEVLEEGVRYGIEPRAAENPGLFLDGRAARQWIHDHAGGVRVIDLFAHHGSLGVAAAAGGAKHVVHVESQRRKLANIRRNHERNGSRIDDRDLWREDVYRSLDVAARRGLSFDLVLLDPPPILPRRGRGPRPRAQDFPTLLPKALRVLGKGGRILAMLHRIDRGRRASAGDLAEIARAAGCSVRVVAEGTSAVDFPEDDPGAKLAFVVIEAAAIANLDEEEA